MSPLPEIESDLVTFSSDIAATIYKFLGQDIGPEESREWHINLGDNKKRKKFAEDLDVQLDRPVEDYVTKDKAVDCTHLVFSTNQKGVYLDLSLPTEFYNDKWMDIGDRKTVVILHRYGEALDKRYIESLTNG